MSPEDDASAGRLNRDDARAELEHVRHECRADKNYVTRPVLRGVTLFGGALGTTGAALAGHQVVAVGTLLVTAVIIIAELWIAKRRDDVFSKVAQRRDADPAVLRVLIVHQAVRSGRLSSGDTVRLLRAEPDAKHDGRSGLSDPACPPPAKPGSQRLG